MKYKWMNRFEGIRPFQWTAHVQKGLKLLLLLFLLHNFPATKFLAYFFSFFFTIISSLSLFSPSFPFLSSVFFSPFLFFLFSSLSSFYTSLSFPLLFSLFFLHLFLSFSFFFSFHIPSFVTVIKYKRMNQLKGIRSFKRVANI